MLVPDRTDVYSSTQAWVLDKIGIGTSVDKGPAENTTRRKMERPKASGVRATEEVLERCGTVQDAVMLAEIYHRRVRRFRREGIYLVFSGVRMACAA